MSHNLNYVTQVFKSYTVYTRSYVGTTQFELCHTIRIVWHNSYCVTQFELCYYISICSIISFAAQRQVKGQRHNGASCQPIPHLRWERARESCSIQGVVTIKIFDVTKGWTGGHDQQNFRWDRSPDGGRGSWWPDVKFNMTCHDSSNDENRLNLTPNLISKFIVYLSK